MIVNDAINVTACPPTLKLESLMVFSLGSFRAVTTLALYHCDPSFVLTFSNSISKSDEGN